MDTEGQICYKKQSHEKEFFSSKNRTSPFVSFNQYNCALSPRRAHGAVEILSQVGLFDCKTIDSKVDSINNHRVIMLVNSVYQECEQKAAGMCCLGFAIAERSPGKTVMA